MNETTRSRQANLLNWVVRSGSTGSSDEEWAHMYALSLHIFTSNIPQIKELVISALLSVAYVQTKISYLYCKIINYIEEHFYFFTIRVGVIVKTYIVKLPI